MKCPHCLTAFHDRPTVDGLGVDATSFWQITKRGCPSCGKFIITLEQHSKPFAGQHSNDPNKYQVHSQIMCYPKGASRTPLGPEIPQKFADDYKEACLTLPDSPKASAALSRRCLQHLLREKAGVKHGNLADEIQQVLDSDKLPSDLADSLDAIRNIGNFAAHPMKSKASGEIIEVEAGEAEWNLDVLESLFDFYFTRPEVSKKKRDALNKKLADAGKPPLK